MDAAFSLDQLIGNRLREAKGAHVAQRSLDAARGHATVSTWQFLSGERGQTAVSEYTKVLIGPELSRQAWFKMCEHGGGLAQVGLFGRADCLRLRDCHSIVFYSFARHCGNSPLVAPRRGGWLDASYGWLIQEPSHLFLSYDVARR
jgi:hypothetical protein